MAAIRTGRSRWTLGVLVLASLTAVTLDLRDDTGGLVDRIREGALAVSAPARDAAVAVFDPVGDALASVVGRGDLRAENERLREQIAELENRLTTSEDAARERDALLNLAGMSAFESIPRVPARVVSEGVGNTDVTIEIDRGTNHGVAEGMPVVTAGGLVGRVVRASPGRSVVLLLTDAGFSVGIRFVTDGDVAVAVGEGRSRELTADLVAPDVELEQGTRAVTSGLQQSVYPPGIPVGVVASDHLPVGGLARRVTLEPAADLGRLSFVSVLLWGDDGRNAGDPAGSDGPADPDGVEGTP